MAISVYGGKMSVKNVLKNFQMSEQYWVCLDKISEVIFSPAETLWYKAPFKKMRSFIFCEIIVNREHVT